MSVRLPPWADEVSGINSRVLHTASNPAIIPQAKDRCPVRLDILVIRVSAIAQPLLVAQLLPISVNY
jgi:hypothetical protein